MDYRIVKSGLKVLAAPTILMGHERNPENVAGLEMMVIKNGDESPSAESPGDIDLLVQSSRELDHAIRESLRRGGSTA